MEFYMNDPENNRTHLTMMIDWESRKVFISDPTDPSKTVEYSFRESRDLGGILRNWLVYEEY